MKFYVSVLSEEENRKGMTVRKGYVSTEWGIEVSFGGIKAGVEFNYQPNACLI